MRAYEIAVEGEGLDRLVEVERADPTPGAGQVVVEVGGAGTLAKSYAALGWSGKIGLIGVMTQAETPAALNPIGLAFKAGNLHGVMVGNRTMFEDMLTAMSANAIKPMVDKVFAWGEARQAYETAIAGDFFGKVVVRI